jgi:phospholipase C
VLNRLQQLPEWSSTAVFITWDDSDGWYDHVMPPIINQSEDPAHDALNAGSCGTKAPLGGFQDRCGHGPRIPLLIISPYAKPNFVDNDLVDTSSIIRFVEDNWNLGPIGGGSFDVIAGSLTSAFSFRNPQTAALILDPNTGEPLE